MDIKVGDVFRFKGADEGVFCMEGEDFPSARLHVMDVFGGGNFCFNVKTKRCPKGFTQFADIEQIDEVLEKVA